MNILFSPIGGTDPISKSFLDKEKKKVYILTAQCSIY